MIGVKCFVHAIKLIDGIISYYTILYRLHIYDVHLIINDVFSVNMLNIDFVKRAQEHSLSVEYCNIVLSSTCS